MSSRDFVGYGQDGFNPLWPNGAKLAVQFVLNYEEGGESCILNEDDTVSEHLLSDIPGASPYKNARHLNMESIYEYGSRAGFWRLFRLFTTRNIPLTVFAVGMALEKNPQAAQAMHQAGWEIASHGYRWIDYQNVEMEMEKNHLQKTVEVHKALFGEAPKGLYQGKPNVRTREIMHTVGNFIYDSDAYNDDLPYWENRDNHQNDNDNSKSIPCKTRPHLIIPYTLCNNDMRFVVPGGFAFGEAFFQYLKDAFDVLYQEGKEGRPKMMTIGLHCRVIGQPGRIKSLMRFMDYINTFSESIWICKREEIAQHWYTHHLPKTEKSTSEK